MAKRELLFITHVLQYLQYIVITLIVILALLIKAPNLVGIETYRVLSNSMKPCFDQNSIVYVDTNTDVKSLKKGDVISYMCDDITVTHRIVNVKTDAFITKGDANESADFVAVSKDNVVGKVVFVVPHLGRVQQLITQNIVAVLCSVFILILTVQFLENLMKEKGENDDEKRNS